MPASSRLLAFVTAVIVGGAVAVGFAVAGLQGVTLTTVAYIVLLGALTSASGRFSVKIPGRSATISVSEVFVFIAIFLYGSAAAILIVAADGLLLSLHQKHRRLDRTLFNIAEPTVSVWIAALAFSVVAHAWSSWTLAPGHAGTFVATLAMSSAFFISNSWLTALAVGLESGTSAIDVWKGHALRLAVNFYAAASLAAVVADGGRGLNLQAIGLLSPLLILSYVAYKEAASRVEQAERHVHEMERLYEEARTRDDALRQAQKLEAIGRLAAGVAHDFNNLLMAIRGNAELAMDATTPDDRVRSELDEILTASDRAAGLTRQLLAFSRQQVIAPRVIRPDRVVASMDKMLRRLIGEHVVLTTSMEPDVAPVRIDPNQLEQVLLNLVVNARDAMPNGGSVRVVLANTRIDAARSAQTMLAPGEYVELSVADTGSGMSDEVKSHVFEPFFTTKQEGRGTGLGLATVYGVVEKAGGTIGIDTGLGRGTTFHILLPTSSEAESSMAGEPDSAPPRDTATGRRVEHEAAVAGNLTRPKSLSQLPVNRVQRTPAAVVQVG